MTPLDGLASESVEGASVFDTLHVVVLDELLAPPALDWVVGRALAQNHRLLARPVGTARGRDGRVGREVPPSRIVLDVDERLADLMRSQIRRALPDVLLRMDHAVVDPTTVDVELTAMEAGGRFRERVDAFHDVHADRQLSYVVFVHSEPRGFTGGRIRIFDSRSRRGGAAPFEVEPVQNRMILFPARFAHEVTEVHVPSGRFEDGCFTVNGQVSW